MFVKQIRIMLRKHNQGNGKENRDHCLKKLFYGALEDPVRTYGFVQIYL